VDREEVGDLELAQELSAVTGRCGAELDEASWQSAFGGSTTFDSVSARL
jgi:hypothetical protein